MFMYILYFILSNQIKKPHTLKISLPDKYEIIIEFYIYFSSVARTEGLLKPRTNQTIDVFIWAAYDIARARLQSDFVNFFSAISIYT